MEIIMNAKIILVVIAIVAVAGVSIIAGESSSAQARGQCHINSGTYGCTGDREFLGFRNTICKTKTNECHSTGGSR
jgi:hypothetical protein